MKSPSPTARTNNFNLLRFVFAALVIVSHGPELKDGDRSHELLTRLFGTLSFGEFAVDSFFLLSGYLILKSWVSQPEPFDYLRKRVLRIYPGFIVVSLLCVFLIGPNVGAPDYLTALNVGAALQSMMLLLPPEGPPVFHGVPYPALNGAVWTIVYEFGCYLMVLLIGLAAGRRIRAAWLVATLALLIAYVRGKRGIAWPLYYPMVRFGMLFAVGGCYYLWRGDLLGRKPWAIGAALLLVPCLFHRNGAELAVAFLWGYLILSFAEAPRAALAWFNQLPDISYGVYLYAWPVSNLLLFHLPGIGRIALVLDTLALSVVLGVLSWYAVEKPFIALKTRRNRPRPVTT